VTSLRRRSGLRSFPRRDPLASPSPARPPPAASSDGRPPSPVGSAAWLPRPASHVLLPPAVVGRLRHFDDTADLDDGLALGDQLLGGFELADDLLPRMPDGFHGEVPGRMRTPIHPGPTCGIQVSRTSTPITSRSPC